MTWWRHSARRTGERVAERWLSCLKCQLVVCGPLTETLPRCRRCGVQEWHVLVPTEIAALLDRHAWRLTENDVQFLRALRIDAELHLK